MVLDKCSKSNECLLIGNDILSSAMHSSSELGINSNFSYYNLPPPVLHNSDFRKLEFDNEIDAVISDPPYGIRATTRKATEQDSNERVIHRSLDLYTDFINKSAQWL